VEGQGQCDNDGVAIRGVQWWPHAKAEVRMRGYKWMRRCFTHFTGDVGVEEERVSHDGGQPMGHKTKE